MKVARGLRQAAGDGIGSGARLTGRGPGRTLTATDAAEPTGGPPGGTVPPQEGVPMYRSPRSLSRSLAPIGPVMTGVIATITLPELAIAQAVPHGPEFQVNDYVLGSQLASAVGVDADGDFVIAWHSFGSPGPDTSYASIQARRYSAAGAPLGAQFQVNTYTTFHQQAPAICVAPQGPFVIAWHSQGSAQGDTSGFSIQAQRFAADGAPQGAQFQVNDFTTGNQYLPVLGVDAQGDFVVAWESGGSFQDDSSGLSVQVRRYAADGTPQGPQLQVNSYTTSTQGGPAIAVHPQGGFVIAWISNGSSETDTSGFSIQAQRYDATGQPEGSQFQVNTYTSGEQSQVAAAIDPTGRFVVAWSSAGSPGTDSAAHSVQARRYAADGSPLGDQFQVNLVTTGGQYVPALFAEPDGGFLITWDSLASAGADASGLTVQARSFDPAGDPRGPDFQVNVTTYGNQRLPALSATPPGDFVIAWQSQASAGDDDEGYSIQARRYDGLFRDGFETGNTVRWSQTSA